MLLDIQEDGGGIETYFGATWQEPASVEGSRVQRLILGSAGLGVKEELPLQGFSESGVPNPRSADQYQTAQQEVSGGPASEASSAAPRRSPSVTLPPEPCTPPPAPSVGKIVFHETGPWCQKGWGPLL